MWSTTGESDTWQKADRLGSIYPKKDRCCPFFFATSKYTVPAGRRGGCIHLAGKKAAQIMKETYDQEDMNDENRY